MSTSEDRAESARMTEVRHEMKQLFVNFLKAKGYSNAEIADIAEINENTVRELLQLPKEEKINWRENCLTGGPHDGRPDKIWNLPLLYAATVLFDRATLKELVVSRIYNDAMRMVEAAPENFTEEWADRVLEEAENAYDRTLQHKVGELSNYYEEARFAKDLSEAARLNKEGKLNAFFEPLHTHDSINLLCRILGVSSEMKARAAN